MKKIFLGLSAALIMSNASGMTTYEGFLSNQFGSMFTDTRVTISQAYQLFPANHYELNNIAIWSKGKNEIIAGRGILELINSNVNTGYFKYRLEIIPTTRTIVNIVRGENKTFILEGKVKFVPTQAYEIYIEGYVTRVNNKISFKLGAKNFLKIKTPLDSSLALQPINDIPVTVEVEKESVWVSPIKR